MTVWSEKMMTALSVESLTGREKPLTTALAFCLIILLAITLRFSGICFDSLWLDESYQSLIGAFGHGMPNLPNLTAETIQGGEAKSLFHFQSPTSVNELLSKFRSVDPLCPPLYAVLLNRWITIFGASDFAVRSLSAVISSMSIALLLFFCRRLISTKAAIFAGILAAVSPFDIHYAQEARMYSLVELFGMISACSLIILLKERKFASKSTNALLLILYAVSTWAMINSHYTSLFEAAAQGVVAASFLLWMKDWRTLALLILAWLTTAILWIPWLPMFLVSAGSRKESFYVARQASPLWPFYALFIRIPINYLAFLCGQRVVAYAIPSYITAALMLLSAAFSSLKSCKEQFAVISLWLWAIVPAGGLWFIDFVENHRVIEVARYTIFSSPAIFMLAGYGLSQLITWRRFFIWLAALHLLFASINIIYSHAVHQREPWKEMAATVEKFVPAERLLLISQHYDLVCLNRYLKRPRLQQGVSPAMGPEAIAQLLKSSEQFALLTAQDGESIKTMIPQQFHLEKQIDYSHGLHLRFYSK